MVNKQINKKKPPTECFTTPNFDHFPEIIFNKSYFAIDLRK